MAVNNRGCVIALHGHIFRVVVVVGKHGLSCNRPSPSTKQHAQLQPWTVSITFVTDDIADGSWVLFARGLPFCQPKPLDCPIGIARLCL